MDTTDASVPAMSYTDEEQAALATGVTPEQIANRRLFFEKQRKDQQADQKARARETLWTPIYPRGIITIPKSLPLGIRART